MPDRVARFAPSPTGPLHLGNLQTALGAWLQARLFNCEFLLRIEDLDRSRCQSKWQDQIVADLQWLGINWDTGPQKTDSSLWLQSECGERYTSAINTLIENEQVYQCFCSRKDIQESVTAPHGPLGTLYPGTCRGNKFTADFDFRKNDTGSLRFTVKNQSMTFKDMLLGESLLQAGRDFGDFVVLRKDNVVAYHLAVVVDDICAGVTDVYRGADLWRSTFPQLCLYQALNAETPQYWHGPLLYDEQGKRLSKRDNSTSLRRYIDTGVKPEHIVGQIASSLGLLERGHSLSCDELLKSLNKEQFIKSIQSISVPEN